MMALIAMARGTTRVQIIMTESPADDELLSVPVASPNSPPPEEKNENNYVDQDQQPCNLFSCFAGCKSKVKSFGVGCR